MHLYQSDGEITDAKSQLPEGVIIVPYLLKLFRACSKAIADGATYVAFGAVYATATKPEAGNVGIEVIKQAAAQYDLPICAIGGLTVENSKPVIEYELTSVQSLVIY